MTKQLDAAELMALQNLADQQAKMRAFNTRAPLAIPEVDPMEAQLIAHFRTCSEKGRKLILLHAASVASLCIGYKTED